LACPGGFGFEAFGRLRIREVEGKIQIKALLLLLFAPLA
jgi:hypothetical protein